MIGKPFAKWINGKMTGTLYPDWSKEQTRDRKCKGSTKCDNGDDVTKVAIAASTDANDINIDNLQKDRVAVRMHVTKKLFGHRPDESKYGLSGRGLLYYLVVQPWPNDPNHPNPNPAGKPAAQWSLVKVDGDQSEIVASGMFQRCCTQSDPQSDPEHCIRPKPSYGDFKDCNTSHRQYSETFLQFQNARSDAEEKQAEARLASLASGSLTASAWVSCSHGCCIAGPK